VVIRPSYVLGGRKMRVVYSYDELTEYLDDLYGDLTQKDITEVPLLVDRFLEAATEVDVDALFDGTELLVGGIMEHVEEAGVHSGDSACVVPPPTLSDTALKTILANTEDLAQRVGGSGPHQHPVRRARRRRLHPRGEPARVAYGAVHLEGQRGPARQGGCPGHDGSHVAGVA
jgi:biotin carboxylase